MGNGQADKKKTFDNNSIITEILWDKKNIKIRIFNNHNANWIEFEKFYVSKY